MDLISHIKKIIKNSRGLSIAITGDNESYLERLVVSMIKEITNDQIDKYMIISTKDSPNIKIDDIRNLQEFLSFRADSGKKFVLLLNAEKLLPEAENALLKILEEPPEYAVIILVTTSWNSLYPTIKSRVFRYNINIPKEMFNEIEDFFAKKLIWTFPERIDEIKNKKFEIVNLNTLSKEKNKLNIYYTLYTEIKKSLGDYKQLNNLARKICKNEDFDILKIVAKVSLWIAEEFSMKKDIDYSQIKTIDKILSSKVANYNYELTYYFILLSLNDAINKN
ncbi:hypothetical protein [Thermosipho atlanticus]|uniref:DNA polymerase-3 subunit delta n=1 Tax=Thermosipho atlanticus DSM 15807 TaxID=1123380 RepID=A0A1M5SG60_9BACT|nr:hypothetical protein [Thermosipho atlanticus]SHH37572.1 DNA polymerase-3 subunit delta' [Thermosipho atlanticus DSM 15807]